MKHDCITNAQGRLPCSCHLHDRNSSRSDPHSDPWGWIDDMRYLMDRALLIVTAIAIVAIAYRIFHH